MKTICFLNTKLNLPNMAEINMAQWNKSDRKHLWDILGETEETLEELVQLSSNLVCGPLRPDALLFVLLACPAGSSYWTRQRKPWSGRAAYRAKACHQEEKGIHARPKNSLARPKCWSFSRALWHSQNLILPPGPSLKQYKESSSLACAPWQIYNCSLSWSSVVLCLYQNNQSKAKKALSPSISLNRLQVWIR